MDEALKFMFGETDTPKQTASNTYQIDWMQIISNIISAVIAGLIVTYLRG